jgi:exodeoxyribonuclease VII large subunit
MDLFALQRPLLTVSELVQRLRRATEEQFGWVRVSGEIAEWKIAASGHAYFTLKDEQAQLAAVMFRPALARLAFSPQEGLEVECLGRATIYERRGQLQLVAEWLVPLGEGLAALRLQQLKKKLQQEGLFDPGAQAAPALFPFLRGCGYQPPRSSAARHYPRPL